MLINYDYPRDWVQLVVAYLKRLEKKHNIPQDKLYMLSTPLSLSLFHLS